MANRAYLFLSKVSDNHIIKNLKEPYYDSRWNIPLLWFLFFDRNSLKLKTVYFEEDKEQIENSWHEIALIEKKDSAIENFSKNIQLLNEVWKQVDKDEEIIRFIENIKRWHGEYLVLDTTEIVEDHEQAFKDFSNSFDYLESKKSVEFVKSLNNYSGNFQEPNLLVKLFANRDYERVSDSLAYFVGHTRW
ncbi:MAG TPA: hypothetical protein PKY59_18955 [Pyrinomonadaceae bacterium]|nr:hypothetical protein [Pyrinomonadaceae bacterium]